MQQLIVLTVALTMVLAPFVCAQPYTEKQFSTNVESGVQYAIAARFNGAADTLRMNVWLPTNDAATQRPCIVWVHGGGFIQGHRNELNNFCSWWAERGYVAITISYRLGLNGHPLLDPPFVYDEAEVIRAVIRGVQDLRSALLWVADNRNTYNIDTSRIVVGGASAGGIIALHNAYWDKTDPVPAAARELAPAVRVSGTLARPALGSLEPPSNTPLPRIRAVVNVFGAVTSLDMLDGAPFVPTFSYHQRGDLVVPCGRAKGLWGLPLDVSANWPILLGSCELEKEFVRRNIDGSQHESFIIDGPNHDVHDLAVVDARAAQFVSRILFATTSVNHSSQNNVESNHGRWLVCDILGRVLQDVTSKDDLSRLTDGLYLCRTPNGLTVLYDANAATYYAPPVRTMP